MTGSSDVKATAAPDTDVTFTHKVWDDGTVGDGKTDTIEGNVYWTGKTSGPIAAAYRVGAQPPPAAQVQPSKGYSTTFTPSGPNGGVSRAYTFHIPKSAKDGDLYCQYITWKPTSSKNATDGHSEQTCVKVVVPDTNTPVLNCSIVVPSSLSPGVPFTVTVNANAGGYNGKPPTLVQLSLTQPINEAHNVGPKSTAPADQNNYTTTFTVVYAAAGPATIVGHVKDLTTGSTVHGDCSKPITVGASQPPPATDTASCTLDAPSPPGPLEVSSRNFTITETGHVNTTRTDNNTTTGPSGWSAWNWTYNTTNTWRSGTQTRTETHTYYKVTQADFKVSYSGSVGGPQTKSGPSAVVPYNHAQTFTFGPENTADTYTVKGAGGFTYTLTKFVDTETQTHTRLETRPNTASAWTTNSDSTGDFTVTKSVQTKIASGKVDCTLSADDTDTTRTITYAELPYMQVFGGDVMAGACPTVFGGSNSGIYGWNNDNGASGLYHNGSQATGYAGAGTSTAAFASGSINSFVSALTNGSLRPAGLSFANTIGVSETQARYGGSFGPSMPVDCSQLMDKSGTTTSGSVVGDLGSSRGYGNSNYTGRNTYYVGNAYISSNITYAGWGSWTKPSEIPRFRLIATGNIYIDSSVSELDGLYIAGGTIYTCANGMGSVVSPSDIYDSCRNKLTVYGAFAAQKVQFLRTGNSLKDASEGDNYGSSKAAEEFIYGPEMWLPDQPNENGLKYDSILGLPPVL